MQQQAASGAAAAERLAGLKAKYQQLSQKVPAVRSAPRGVYGASSLLSKEYADIRDC